MSRERDDRGQFTETVTLADVLGVFDAVDGPVVTSGDVADHTGCSRDTARRKLERLEAQHAVDSRETAGRVVYWRIDEATPSPVDPSDPIFTDPPTFESGRDDLSSSVDDILYGDGA